MTAGIQFKPLTSDFYIIPKAQLLFRPAGNASFELLGDSDDVTITINIDETERFTNEAGIQLLAKAIVTKVDAVLGLTLVQLSDRNRALSLLGELTFEVQTADAAAVVNISDVEVDDKIYPLDHFNITSITSVTDGIAAETYLDGVHFRADLSGGFIQFIGQPAGADADVIVTYDAPEVLSSDEVTKIGIASKTENRGTLIIRGTNEVGPRSLVQLHDVQLRPDGERNYVSDVDLDTIEVIGRIFRDETQPVGFELGFERELL